MCIGCLADVNDILSIKFCLNRQGDSVVSEVRESRHVTKAVLEQKLISQA